MNFYFYPPPYPKSRPVNYNPYTDFFRSHLAQRSNVVNCSEANSALGDLFKHITKFDVVIFNWIENIGTKPFGKLQFLIFLFLFLILRIRRVKIVWIMHNIHPHTGDTFVSRSIKRLMYKYSSLIITHSQEAKLYVQQFSKRKVVFFHHPVDYQIPTKLNHTKDSEGILIWGSIERYKGVLEFLKNIVSEGKDSKIRIVGKCYDDNYRKEIEKVVENNQSIVFENRRVPFEELQHLISDSQFVLFPYISESVSSSGALMDTLRFGGNVVGPNKGAFKDLNEEGVCHIFNSYTELLELLQTKTKIGNKKIDVFLKTIDWPVFVGKLIEEIEC